ncbi:FAD/NAD(P)-binding protein [uncultured Bradyrhizobium sp.]|uniref:FAD/NAD(P)-binding protein n=1 Tax=uncultured Bradyrhizobium sp. TaxID=199684 RepID=UPI0035CB49AD
MNPNIIAIVGGGATAISLIESLENELRAEAMRDITIFVIEKRHQRGRGLAYDVDLHTNLLNTRAGYITPFPTKPGHFYNWITANRGAWEDEFTNLEINESSFVPRPLFGLYLEHVMNELSGKLAGRGVNLVHLRAEVTDVRRAANGDFVLITDTSLMIRADRVVLACGNLQSRELSSLQNHAGFFNNPYPVRRLVRTIKPDSKVAILGARLGAIDVAVGLARSDHYGPITMISRSGYFPSVRGTQGRYTPQILTLERLRQHGRTFGKITLEELTRWIIDEVHLAGGRDPELADLPPSPPDDPLRFFQDEIKLAERPRPWQAVLYATNPLIDCIWQLLDDADKQVFLNQYQAAWMSYRVSIPVENAKQLIDLCKSGRLAFKSGRADVQADGSGFHVAVHGRDRIDAAHFDCVVGAFGSPRDARLLDSILVQNLLSSGLARCHRHGGLEVKYQSGRLIEDAGQSQLNIWALGELTAGVNFFTSALEINARHAAQVARDIVKSLKVLMPSALPEPEDISPVMEVARDIRA